jgi:hypothetical protein
VRLGWDLGDLVALASIRTDQTNRDQGAPKAVELGIQEETAGLVRWTGLSQSFGVYGSLSLRAA